jgi:hypothetical protein
VKVGCCWGWGSQAGDSESAGEGDVWQWVCFDGDSVKAGVVRVHVTGRVLFKRMWQRAIGLVDQFKRSILVLLWSSGSSGAVDFRIIWRTGSPVEFRKIWTWFSFLDLLEYFDADTGHPTGEQGSGEGAGADGNAGGRASLSPVQGELAGESAG